MVVLAPITLDTTLADLYRQAKLGDVRKNIEQVFCETSSALRLTPGLLRNAEFLYQDSSFNSTPPLELNAGNQTLQRSLALKYLSLVPQRDTFVCGDTAVIRFDIGEGEEEIQHVRVEAGKTLSVLDSNQRPRIVYSSGPSTSSWRRTVLICSRTNWLLTRCNGTLHSSSVFPISIIVARSTRTPTSTMRSLMLLRSI